MREIHCPQTYRIQKEYPIYLGKGILEEVVKRIKPFQPNKVIVVTDSNVRKLYGEKITSILRETFPTDLIEIPAGEEHKTFECYQQLCHDIINEGVSKKTFLLLMGGGVLGNLAGFAASTIMRGLHFAHIPTTVMAQVDSTTGGKQAINLPQGKNLLGVFNDPQFILIDIDFLKTLSPREISCGLAECIKHALCQDEAFAQELLRVLNPEARYTEEQFISIIQKTIHLKINVLRMDPKEINEGKILVYGHTIGHAIETLSKGKLNHGEAISIGMVAAAKASVFFNEAKKNLIEIHETILKKAGLPTKIPSEITIEQIISQLKYDKKIAPAGELVLLEEIGKIHAIEGRIGDPVTADQVRTVLKECY